MDTRELQLEEKNAITGTDVFLNLSKRLNS